MTVASTYLLAYKKLESKPPLLVPVEGRRNKFIFNLSEIPGVVTPTLDQLKITLRGKEISASKWRCRLSAQQGSPLYVTYQPSDPERILSDTEATDKIIKLLTSYRDVNYDLIKQHPFIRARDNSGFIFDFNTSVQYRTFRSLLKLKARKAIGTVKVLKPYSSYDNVHVKINPEYLDKAEVFLKALLQNPNENIQGRNENFQMRTRKRKATKEATGANDNIRTIEANYAGATMTSRATRQKIPAPPFAASFGAPASMPRSSTVDLYETPPVSAPGFSTLTEPAASFEMPLMAPPPPIPIVFNPFFYGNPDWAQFIMISTMPPSFAAPIPLPSAVSSFPSATTIMADNSGFTLFAPQQPPTSLPASDLSDHRLTSYVQQTPRF